MSTPGFSERILLKGTSAKGEGRLLAKGKANTPDLEPGTQFPIEPSASALRGLGTPQTLGGPPLGSTPLAGSNPAVVREFQRTERVMWIVRMLLFIA